MDVEFRPLAVGATHVPIKITGPGTLELREAGLLVVGAKVAIRGRSLAFLLGLIAVAAVTHTRRAVVGLDSTMSGGVGIGVARALVAAMLRRPARAGAPVEQRFRGPTSRR